MINRLFAQSPLRLSLISGLCIGLSYPPLKLGFLSWIGLVPLLVALEYSEPRQSAKLAFLSGITANLIVMYWMAFNIGAHFLAAFASMVASIVYLSLFWGLVGYVFSLFHVNWGKGYFIFPFLWVSMEYFQSFGSLGFPWISLATTQSYYLPLVQMVEFTGIYGISILLVTVNVLIYRYIRIPSVNKLKVLRWGVILVVVPWLFGYGRMAMINQTRESGDIFRVSIVQPNVGPHEKWAVENRDWIFHHLDSLYIEAAKTDPQLIVWPESATPTYLRKNWRRMKQVSQRVEEYGIPLLTGIVDWEYEKGKRKIYNSVLLIDPENNKESNLYHKIQLVPFGEYIPFSNQFEVLDQLNLGQGNFDSGQNYTLFDVDSVSFSSVICFESAFPKLVRKFVKKGAEFLVVVVNDGWFGQSSEPYQHEILSRFRAIENRIPVVRCANTGISVIYDAVGRVQSYLPLNKEGVISAGITPGNTLTYYTKFGDQIAHLSVLITVILGIWFWYREK